MNLFEEKFDSYVCHGDQISVESEGFTITARIVYDDFYDIDDDDVHNPDQSVTGCDDEQHEKLMYARQQWKRNEWFYCGIVLSVSKAGVLLDDYAASLWGIEANYPGTNNSYLTDVANELLSEAVDLGHAVVERLTKSN